jgi:hypothetical protein
MGDGISLRVLHEGTTSVVEYIDIGHGYDG